MRDLFNTLRKIRRELGNDCTIDMQLDSREDLYIKIRWDNSFYTVQSKFTKKKLDQAETANVYPVELFIATVKGNKEAGGW